MRFVGRFAFWLSTIHKTLLESLKNFAITYENQIEFEESKGNDKVAEELREKREEANDEAKYEACKAFIDEFVEQYGEDFIDRLIDLLNDERFHTFFVDVSASENLKAVTLDPELPQSERMSAKARADRASGCLIPLEIIQELAEKKAYIENYEKEESTSE